MYIPMYSSHTGMGPFYEGLWLHYPISEVVTPAPAAADTAAPLTECALKMAVSMPALPSKDFNHLANVEELIGL